MTIALSGAGGFLGWHTRCAAHAAGTPVRSFGVGDAFDADAAATAVSGAARLVHLAGVNRAADDEISEGNLLFARQASDAMRRAAQPPRTVVFADSVQAGNGTVYGSAKARAADVLREAAEAAGADFIDVRLPNVFGEHGRPFYNSVVATFVHQLVAGSTPHVEQDRELTLLHAQNAADLLLGATATADAEHLQVRLTVAEILARLTTIARRYSGAGEIPDLVTGFDRDLFNTYRAGAFETTAPLRPTRNADNRGSFFEVVRAHGGASQTSFSTTAPAVTRGQHYHRRKVERFTVVSGEAVIAVRRLFSDRVHEFRVSGHSPASIDMPTMWPHHIRNVGDGPLLTSFWSNELFDPAHPDTIPEPV